MASGDQSVATEDQDGHDYQTATICSDCGGDRNVLEYCVNCKANICNECRDKQLHKQLKVLARTDPEVRNAVALLNRPCKDHPSNEFISFCDRCQKRAVSSA